MLTPLLTAWLALAPADAAELAGVTLPDAAKAADGTALVLNGMGLREKWWIDIYVGGLYLPTKTTDAKQAITADVPKRIVMDFIYRKVTIKQMKSTFSEGLEKNPETAQMTDKVAKLMAMIDRDVQKGDQVVIDYVPGKGTTFTFQGQVKGTIEGAAFMRGIWSIFLGDAPASEDLKQGMLGG